MMLAHQSLLRFARNFEHHSVTLEISQGEELFSSRGMLFQFLLKYLLLKLHTYLIRNKNSQLFCDCFLIFKKNILCPKIYIGCEPPLLVEKCLIPLAINPCGQSWSVIIYLLMFSRNFCFLKKNWFFFQNFRSGGRRCSCYCS